jgi:hypothetical protein
MVKREAARYSTSIYDVTGTLLGAEMCNRNYRRRVMGEIAKT